MLFLNEILPDTAEAFGKTRKGAVAEIKAIDAKDLRTSMQIVIPAASFRMSFF